MKAGWAKVIIQYNTSLERDFWNERFCWTKPRTSQQGPRITEDFLIWPHIWHKWPIFECILYLHLLHCTRTSFRFRSKNCADEVKLNSLDVEAPVSVNDPEVVKISEMELVDRLEQLIYRLQLRSWFTTEDAQSSQTIKMRAKKHI